MTRLMEDNVFAGTFGLESQAGLGAWFNVRGSDISDRGNTRRWGSVMHSRLNIPGRNEMPPF